MEVRHVERASRLIKKADADKTGKREPTAMDWVKAQSAVPMPSGKENASPAPASIVHSAPADIFPKAGSQHPDRHPNEVVKEAGQREQSGALQVHKNREAAEIAEEAGAKAVTIGKDIYLGDPVSDMESTESRAILAHEMKHVEQFTQSSGIDWYAPQQGE